MSLLPSAGGPVPATDTNTATESSNVPDAPAEIGERGGALASVDNADATPNPDQPATPEQRPGSYVLMATALSLFIIGFTVWLIFAWTGYSSKYSQTTDSWKLNSTKMIEITLVAEDRDNLSCASDVLVEGLHCAYRANQQPFGDGTPANDSQILQPYNTVANELFLGAGLWTSKALPKVLPGVRFTVVCNYKVLGAAKSMALRWAPPPKGSFDPLKNSVAVGTLTDCVIPE